MELGQQTRLSLSFYTSKKKRRGKEKKKKGKVGGEKIEYAAHICPCVYFAFTTSSLKGGRG